MTNSSSAYGTVQGTIFDNEDRPLYVTDANGATVANTGDCPGLAGITPSAPSGESRLRRFSSRVWLLPAVLIDPLAGANGRGHDGIFGEQAHVVDQDVLGFDQWEIGAGNRLIQGIGRISAG